MDKEKVLEQLRNAKVAHIGWVQRAKMLISGFKMDETAIPVNSTECQFGKWFYSDAQHMNGLSNNPLDCMEAIEELHFNLHDIYMNIYQIYYNSDNRGFFGKLFGRKNRVSEDASKLARSHYKNMEQVSKELVNQINLLERRIVAYPAEEFSKL